MMVRRLSLIVLVLVALAAMSTASAQPTTTVGPWSTLEKVSETLQERQERKDELVDRVEESFPNFYARNAEQLELPLLLTPLRLSAPPVVSSPVAAPAGPPPAPAAAPAPAPARPRFVPYQPLVLGSFFGSATATPAPVPPPAPAPSPEAPVVPVVVEPPTPAPVAVPRPVQAPAPKPVKAPQLPPPPPPAEPVVARPADAYLNFSDGPFPAAHSLTVGSPDAWYRSPVVTELLGHNPNEAKREGFKAEVVAKVEDSFRRSGLDIDLTTEPGQAAHTLSVVSGALAKDNPAAIGIAEIGGDGFTFLDNFTSDVIDSIDDLETAVAKNISHELMHAFGVDYHDEGGESLDSGTIRWDLLIDEDLSFSSDAVSLLSSVNFQERWNDVVLAGAQNAVHGQGCSCHPDGAHATPEPTTLVMWGLTLVGGVWSGRRWRLARA